jgi:AraC family transcriptional regulator, transcriptional activator of pobA
MTDYHIEQDFSPEATTSGQMPGSHSSVPVPRYALYGDEAKRPDWTVNLERMEERSRRNGGVIRPHIHPRFAQMMLITAGHGEMLIEGEREPFGAGQVLMVPTHRIHGYHSDDATRGWVLTLETHYLDDLLQRAPALRPMLLRPGVFDLSLGLLEQLAPDIAALEEELEGSRKGSSIGVEIHLMAILLRLFRHWPAQGAVAVPGHGHTGLVARYRALVEERFRQQPGVDWMAGQLGVSVSQLRLACTRITGLSPLAILHERVLAEARRYLGYTAMPVTAIAHELGFSEASYFTRFFTRQTGEPPTTWRVAHGARSGLESGGA